MFPLLPFVAGVVTGAVALRLLKTDKSGQSLDIVARQGLDKARDSLRNATISSLEVIESASGRARAQLTAPPSAAPAAPAATKPARKRAPRAAKPAGNKTVPGKTAKADKAAGE